MPSQDFETFSPQVLPDGWVEAWCWEGGVSRLSEEWLAQESPLEIRIDGKPWSVSLRTPGEDPDLILGLLFAEGLIRNAAECRSLTPLPGSGAAEIWQVELRRDPEEMASSGAGVAQQPIGARSPEPHRTLPGTSSCGLCGKTAWEEAVPPESGVRETRLTVEALFSGFAAMRRSQGQFERTGGTHAAAAMDAEGRVLAFAEDIGRHNAVDKVVGRLLAEGTLPQAAALLASGRLSYEITAKVYRAGIPVLAGVSAPSSLAVASAEAFGLTLLGFCRGTRATAYAGSQRLRGFPNPPILSTFPGDLP